MAYYSNGYTYEIINKVTRNSFIDAYGNRIEQNNLYGAAAIYSYEWFNAQAWYAHLQNVTNLWAVDVSTNRH